MQLTKTFISLDDNKKKLQCHYQDLRPYLYGFTCENREIATIKDIYNSYDNNEYY